MMTGITGLLELSGNSCGLILVGEAADDYTIRALRSSDYPFVMLEKSIKILRLNTVCTDVREGTQRVIDHIDKLGYKNILIVTDRIHSGKDTSVIEIIKEAIEKKPEMNKPVIIEYDHYINGTLLSGSQIDKYLRPPYRAEIMIIRMLSLSIRL
jgi:DNA-binding LacI/PurR family transcriptional regulator